MDDAPVTFHRFLQKYLLNSVDSLANAGLDIRVSACAPCLRFVSRKGGGSVADITAQIGDVLGRDEPGEIPNARAFSGHRFGAMKVREKPFAHVGSELPQENDFAVKLT